MSPLTRSTSRGDTSYCVQRARPRSERSRPPKPGDKYGHSDRQAYDRKRYCPRRRALFDQYRVNNKFGPRPDPFKGDVLAFINGGVSGSTAIQATGDGDRYIVIGAFANLQYSNVYMGMGISGNTIVRNDGVITGESVAVGVIGPTNGFFTNNGQINITNSNAFGIVYDSYKASTYTIINSSDGVISNTNQPTIWSTVSNLTLSVNNKGLIDSSYQAIWRPRTTGVCEAGRLQ